MFAGYWVTGRDGLVSICRRFTARYSPELMVYIATRDGSLYYIHISLFRRIK